MMVTLTFNESPEFKKDFKRLRKRYRTLPNDFFRLKKVALSLYHLQGVDSRTCFEIPGCITDDCSAFKVKKFSCRSLRGGAKSGLRVIYLFSKEDNKVLFLEMYYKGDKKLENRERIKKYLNQL